MFPPAGLMTVGRVISCMLGIESEAPLLLGALVWGLYVFLESRSGQIRMS